MKKRLLFSLCSVFVLALIGLGIYSACRSDVGDGYVAPEGIIVETPEEDVVKPIAFKTKIKKNAINQEVVTVTATVSPEFVVDKTLSWKLEWNASNPSYNVTDYVTMSISDDTLSVNITYVKQFNVQIKLTATSNMTSSVSASCLIDCYQRSDSDFTTGVRYNNSGNVVTADTSNNIILSGVTYKGIIDGASIYVNSVANKTGTIDTYTKTVYAFTLNASLCSALGISGKTLTYVDQYEFYIVDLLDEFGIDITDSDTIAVLNQYNHWFNVNVTFTDYSDSAKTISVNSVSKSFAIKGFTVSDGILVTNITLDKSQIIF